MIKFKKKTHIIRLDTDTPEFLREDRSKNFNNIKNAEMCNGSKLDSINKSFLVYYTFLLLLSLNQKRKVSNLIIFNLFLIQSNKIIKKLTFFVVFQLIFIKNHKNYKNFAYTLKKIII